MLRGEIEGSVGRGEAHETVDKKAPLLALLSLMKEGRLSAGRLAYVI